MAFEPTPPKEARRSWLRWPRATPWILLTLAVILLAGLLIEAVQRIGYVLWPIFVPLLISSALAYILDPVVTWCERLGMPRRRAILVTLLGSAITVVLFFVFVVPRLVAQFAESANRLPALVQLLLEQVQPILGAVRRINEGMADSLNARITQYVEDPSLLTVPALEWLHNGVGGVLGLTTSLFEAILIPFFVYYILRDLPKLRKSVELLIPPRHRTTSHEVFDRVAAVGSNFIRGQLTVCAAMAVLDSIGFLVLGVPMPIFLGALAGFGHLIPYVGPISAALLTVSLTALDSPEWWRIVGVLGVFAGVQAIEVVFLTPLILGNKLELHPFWVLAGITIAGHLFGILGMILASPVIAISKVLLTYFQRVYLQSRFYQGPVPVLRPPPPDESPPERTRNVAEAPQFGGDPSISPVSGDPA